MTTTDARVQGGSSLSLKDAYLVCTEGGEACASPPMTVECWARLDSSREANVLVAFEPRESSTHWELYTEMGTGRLCAHFSWHDPFEIRSESDVTDGEWHHLAMQFDGREVVLFVDAKEVARRATKVSAEMPRQKGELTIGLEPSLTPVYDCDGEMGWMRVRQTIGPIVPMGAAAPGRDEKTIALWTTEMTKGVGAGTATGDGAWKLERKPRQSLDELDRQSFAAGPSPLDSPVEPVYLLAGAAEHPAGAPMLVLDGEWEMAEEGEEAHRLNGQAWVGGIPAMVPGSVHAALRKAGQIPDPTVGKQDAAAREKSFRTYWYRREFDCPAGLGPAQLVFDGVAVRCTVWLNGEKLGSHEGMFGGPSFDVTRLLRQHNVLVVKIDPAPLEISQGFPNQFFKGMNVGWMRTVVFNNVYGWHYSNIPSLGIWQSVRLEGKPAVRMNNPFVVTRDARGGVVEVIANLEGQTAIEGTLIGTVRPENFEGPAYHFRTPVKSTETRHTAHVRFAVADPHLWWPNGLGDPNLYRLTLSFVPSGEGVAETRQTTFGIRTVEMTPLPGGANPGRYNWTFVINRRPVFVKGNGWCTMDPLMDFSRQRYDRFLSLAQQQHVQMVRCWGSGMPEADEFYELCDRKGIMVLQEWPTAWNSHNWQPYEQLEETVRLNTLRLRNHPSLVMWGGGNESDRPFGPAIDMMGRYAVELDGTRPFHRGEPWGGSRHDYTCWWGKAPLDFNLTLVSHFFGEFGLACSPVYESVLRYLPEGERKVWPPPADGAFAYHTPVFNTMEDLSRLLQYAADFNDIDSMEKVTVSSQLAQATGVRHTLERARTRWPDCTGALYYKMNDNYPAASWSCADWYGAPKISHYVYQDSFAPLHACVLFESFETAGKAITLPVFLMDDADALRGQVWGVRVRAFNDRLEEIRRQNYEGSDSIHRVRRLGEFELSSEETRTAPLLVVVEIRVSDELVHRTFYWSQFRKPIGCLFKLPRTQVQLQIRDGKAIVTNTGEVPAVGVNLQRPGHADTFWAGDNYFWLDPDERREIEVENTAGIVAHAWNAGV